MTDTVLVARDARANESKSPGGGASRPVAFRNVLVGVDGTSTGRDAIALGEKLRDPDGRLTLAHVVLAQTPTYRYLYSTPRWRQARGMLAHERATANVWAGLAGTYALSVGAGLHQLADDHDADLLVVGSSSHGPIGRLLYGDGTRGSLSGAACAVAVAPRGYSRRSGNLTTIGVAYDGGPESEMALTAGRALAGRHGAAVRVMTVVTAALADAASRRQTLGNSLLAGATIRGTTNLGPALTAASWSAAAGRRSGATIEALEHRAREKLKSMPDVEPRVTVGSVRDELVAFGDELDLLVTGSRGHGLLRRLIHGSTTAYLARSARCPLLVLPRPLMARHAGNRA